MAADTAERIVLEEKNPSDLRHPGAPSRRRVMSELRTAR
jgi:hypothetical protein